MRLLPITINYNLIIPYLKCLVYEKKVNKKPRFTLCNIAAVNHGLYEFIRNYLSASTCCGLRVLSRMPQIIALPITVIIVSGIM